MTRSDDTIEVVLTDEATRRIVQRVLWRIAGNAIGNRFDDVTWCWPEDSDARYQESRREGAGRVQSFHEISELVDRVDAAAIGDTVDVAAGFAEVLDDTRRGVEECPFWDCPQDGRERLLAIHATMVALADQLPAGAVA